MNDACRCPDGQAWNDNTKQCVAYTPDDMRGTSCPSCGNNPINPAFGNEFKEEVDFVGLGSFPLEFRRYYNSDPVVLLREGKPLGTLWRHNYSRSVALISGRTSGYSAGVYRPDGKINWFSASTMLGAYTGGRPHITGTLTPTSSGGNLTGWVYVSADGDLTETYNVLGNLTSITNRAGLTQTIAYDIYNRMASVTDAFGRAMTFAYDTKFRIASITRPGGSVYQFAYEDTKNNLVSVTYPGSQVRQYVYEDTSFANALTGIIDENTQRHLTLGYDTQGRATSSTLAGGAESITVVYNVNGTATSTDALGAVRTYGFTNINGVLRSNSITGTVCPTCGPASQTYDTNGFPATAVDWNGNRTNFVRADPQGRNDLETSRTEGLTSGGSVISGVTRTIETTWHATFRLPTLITEKNSAGTTLRTTAMGYDTVGNMLTRTVTDVPLSKSRTWTYTYNANGQVLTMNGPRTDVSDVTTYTYYANNDSDLGKRGNIATITNALGHVTNITAYNAHGQPLTIVDPNGLTTTLAYDARMRLTSRNVGGEITSYTYDGVGQLTNVTMPDASYLTYTYDAAHRLTQIADNLGNKIVYTLDAMGNRTKEEVFDPGNTLAQTRSRVFNTLNRLTQEIGAASQTTTYTYDNQGNVTSIDGPLAGTGDTTTNTYDALNRLTRMTDPNTGQINYGYNALDQMTTVQDPRTLTTSYGVDALNNQTTLTSPDTGASSKTFDAAGNVLTATDARGKTGTYTYDALNRVTSVSYGTNNASNVTYIYDTGTYGLGRLTQMNYSGGFTSWGYDQKGRVIRAQQSISPAIGLNPTTVINYAYDSQGRLSSIYYPSGKQVVYGYDSAGRIASVTVDGHALVSGVTYHPFGTPKSWNWGNGGTSVRTFDSDGRMATHTIGGVTRTVSYDPASRIYQIDDGTPLTTNTYTYDTLDRLTSYISSATNQAYTYDLTGNRTQLTIGANTYTNTIASTSNRLSSTSGPAPAKNYTYDAAGNATNDGARTFTYRDDGRYSSTSVPWSSTIYYLNGMGQRVGKTLNLLGFVYDEAGRLIGEYGSGSATVPVREYVYMGDMLVGVLTNNAYVIDNTATTTAVVGTWPTGGGQTAFGSSFRTHAAGTGTNSFTWTPTLPSSGSYRVYSRWVAGADRATNATYEITGTAGTTTVAVNQQLRDGEWVLLGTFAMAPGVGHNVRLTDNANGLVVADAVKFVPDNASTVYAVHTDHLNTPRLVVDQNQVAVWRWDQTDPFGNNTANEDPDGNSITFEFPLRFPGQYLDKETNTHYNYYRDYDPSVGRYVESDPIGLRGGINTYAYVGSNPLTYTDETGQIAWVIAGAGIGAAVNVAITVAYNASTGQSTSWQQVGAAAASGAISGAFGALGGPLGGTIARAIGARATSGWAVAGSAAFSAAGGYVGQVTANCIDPANASNPLNAALWAGLGGGLATNFIFTPGLTTIRQAQYFGPTTFAGVNSSAIVPSAAASGAVGGGSVLGWPIGGPPSSGCGCR